MIIKEKELRTFIENVIEYTDSNKGEVLHYMIDFYKICIESKITKEKFEKILGEYEINNMYM